VIHGIEQILLKMDRTKKRTLILEQVCNDRDALTPFGSFGPILLEALSTSQDISQPKPSLMGSSGSTASLKSFGARSTFSRASRVSAGGRSFKSKSTIAERLYSLCHELNAPTEFAELVVHHLWQVDLANYSQKSKSKHQNTRNKSNKTLVAFMAEIFQHCTRDFDLLVVAIDDIHLADELSWKVIQEIFEAPANCLLLCTSRPLTQYQLAIDPAFWSALQSDYAITGKYSAINLKRLNKSETTEMIAKKLEMPKELVGSNIQRSVFYQSLGIPHFVNVMLESMKKNELSFSESLIGEGRLQALPDT
jgi:hypothetical protein